ncbi:MAG: hypothetical protein C5B50_20960 [Verrucomicrobia bacterium]|nr:MAG: hypothetical protein C5B50_20960 [Verrucomicrobiota bacterium]
MVSSQKKAPKVHSPQSTVEEQRAEVSGQWSVVSGHKTVVNGRLPKVSVIVANYNGERTLAACLESLERLNYPDYEIILVDDGSTDTSPQIAYQRPKVRYFRHSRNLGLSAARNTGIGAATGEIVAFADSDCRADEDWLYYLVSDLLGGEFVGIGGPNLLPPEDSPVAAAVMASPGGPAHVMLTDRQAEHIPGCNMAFYKWALVEIGGFDPAFQRAGDDVDICWRLQQAGWKIGFSPAGFVWHYRRSTVAEYLRQQEGYGEAEALLVRKHPEYFNSLGGSMWKGRIYTTAKFGLLLRPSVIYRGLFASAGFQSLYAAEPAPSLMLCTAIEYHLFVTLPLWVLAAIFQNLLPLAIFGTLLPASVCAAAGAQAALPRRQTRRWSRALIALLFFLQPIVRGYARYKSRLLLPRAVVAPQQNLDSMALRSAPGSLRELAYWWQTQRSADSLVRGSPGSPAHTEAAALPSFDRLAFVTEMLRRLDEKGWPNRSDSWSDYDVEIFDARWSKVQITTVVEEHPGKGKFLHCRLKPGWSLRAKVSFGTACATELLLLGLLSAHHAWPWLLLISLPLFAWFLHHQGRALQSVLAVFLDELAKQTGLVKVRAEEVQAPKPETRSPKPEVQTPQSTVQLPKSEVIEGRGKQLPASSI